MFGPGVHSVSGASSVVCWGFRVRAKPLDEVLCDESEPELTMESTHEEYEGTELCNDHAQRAWVLEYSEQRPVAGLRGIARRADMNALRLTWRCNGARLYQLYLHFKATQLAV